MHFSLSSQTFSSFYSFVNSTLKLFSSFFCNGCWQLLFILCTITSESLWHLTLLTLTVGCCLSYQDCWDFVLLNMSSKEESCLAQISIVQLTTWGFSNIKTFWGKKNHRFSTCFSVLPFICYRTIYESTLSFYFKQPFSLKCKQFQVAMVELHHQESL